MKGSLSALGCLLVVLFAAPAAVLARGEVDLRAAIASRTITANGKVFPQTMDAPCALYQTTSASPVGAIDLEGPMHVKKTVSLPPGPPLAVIYSPPSNFWAIQTYQRVVTSAGGTYQASDDAQPPNFTYLAAGDYQSVQNELHSYIASLNIPNVIQGQLDAQISTFIQSYISYSQMLSTSHAQVRHIAQVWGTGVINPNQGHSWYHGYIAVTLVCVPNEVHDKQGLKGRLKSWVDGVVKFIITPRLQANPT